MSGRVSQMIGWSQESKLIYELIKQTETLNTIVSGGQPSYNNTPVSKMIGSGNETSLYYEWLRSLDKLTQHYACGSCTTTTTTTCAPIPPINTLMLFDFSQTGSYANGNATVADLSGNGYDAIPVNGVSPGTPEVLGFPAYNYDAGLGIMNAVTGHSLRLTNNALFNGLAPYTFSVWFKSPPIGNGEYTGLVSCTEGSSGYTFSFYNSGGVYGFLNYRWDAAGTPIATILTFGSGGVPAFVPDKWYFAVGGFDGTNLYISLYDGVHRYDAQALGNYVIDTVGPGQLPMIGLRYNQWFIGDYGYIQIQDNWGGCGNSNNIFNATKARYGY